MKVTYAKMTNEDFDRILEQIVGRMSAGQILSVPGCDVALREELNNEVLETWEKENPELAKDWSEEEALINHMDRERVVELLEGEACIQCRDSEGLDTLREALLENVKDGTILAESLAE